MLTIDDESILEDFEKAEQEEPSPAKVIDNTRIIYGSRKLRLPSNSLWGQPVLCDFGEARIGKSHKGLIQPELYRAPEVLFNMEWGSSVDIWNVASLVIISAFTCAFLLLRFNDRFGIYLRIGICSTRLMKTWNRRQPITPLKWLPILAYLHSNTYKEAKSQKRFWMSKVSNEIWTLFRS